MKEELLNYLDNGEFLLYVSLSAIVITFVINLIFRRHKYVKYFPGLIYMAIGLFNLITVRGDITNIRSMDSILLFLILFASGSIGIFFALIIGIYNKPKKNVKKIKMETSNE